MRYDSILSTLSHQSHMGLTVFNTLHPIQGAPTALPLPNESSVKPDPSPLSRFYSFLSFLCILPAPFLSSCHSGLWLKLVGILGWGWSSVVELLWGPRLNPSTTEKKDWVTLTLELAALRCPGTSGNTVCLFASNSVGRGMTGRL